MSAETHAEKKKPTSGQSAWIVSPTWDMIYFVATPLLVLPIVLWAAHSWVTPEQISLLVVAFALLGHHLPGFMRMFGDRELFARFRWRFLLAPPVIFVVSLAFLTPTLLSDPVAAFSNPQVAFSPLNGFSGLELVVAFWATWHGLMQAYGFMRIYDMKRGVNRLSDAWLDFSLCLGIFACGIVFSQSRVYNIMEVMWQTGIPQFGPQWLTVTQWAIGGTTALIAAAYLVRVLTAGRRGDGINWVKLLLILTTGGLYWTAGALTTNMLIGLALFDIFHCVQYNAFVWVFNCQRRQRSGSRFGPLGFMFRDRWSMLGLYLFAIAAYGAIRYFTDGVENPMAQTLLLAFFTTSTILHYYTDGFIWKVGEQKTQRNLNVAVSTAWRDQINVPGVVHFGKCAALLGLLVVFFMLQQDRGPNTPEANSQRLANLVAWSPESPELMIAVSKQKLSQGDVDGSIRAARKAFALRPRSYVAASALGDALHQAGKNRQARDAFLRAIELKPKEWSHHFTLGAISLALDDEDAARGAFEAVVALRPDDGAAREVIGDAYWFEKRPAGAIRYYREALKITDDGDSKGAVSNNTAATLLKLARSLSAGAQYAEAISTTRRVIAADPNNAAAYRTLAMAQASEGHYDQAIASLEQAIKLGLHTAQIYRQLGIAQIETGQLDRAESSLQTAIDLEPQTAANYFQLGNVMFYSGRIEAAARSFGRATRLDPKLADGYVNLGAAYHQLGRLRAAEKAYREGLSLNPKSAQAHYNLGLILLSQDKPNEARENIGQARQLGVAISPEVARAIGL